MHVSLCLCAGEMVSRVWQGGARFCLTRLSPVAGEEVNLALVLQAPGYADSHQPIPRCQLQIHYRVDEEDKPPNSQEGSVSEVDDGV